MPGRTISKDESHMIALSTLILGVGLFALFFGLVAACDHF